MIKIKCKENLFDKLKGCIKYGDCPKDYYEAENPRDYCYDKCEYNIDNIEFEDSEDDIITIKTDIEDLEIKVCMFATTYNYKKCGMVRKGEDCDKCKFYYENIKIIKEAD